MEQANITDKRLLNLRPSWQPGQSGNPNGRPKTSLTELLRDKLEANDGEYKFKIVQELINIATNPPVKTQVHALSMILDRIDGKLIERHVNLNVTTTPELLEQARMLLLEDKTAEQSLIAEYSRTDSSIVPGNPTPDNCPQGDNNG